MKIRGLDYIFYNVADLQKSLAFYRDILGLKTIGEVKETWAEFDLGNNTFAIGVFGASTNPGVKNDAAMALAVDDIKSAVEFLKSKGVVVTQDVMSFDPCEMAMIQDPDRNEIILHQRKDGTVG